MPETQTPHQDETLEGEANVVTKGHRSLRAGALATAAMVLLTGCGATTASPTEPVTVDTSSAQSELDRGLEAHVAGDFDTAMRHYRAALAIEPDNEFAHYNIGLIEQLNGRMSEAETSYRAALDINPEYVPALFNLAIVRSQDTDWSEAVELYERVIELEPDRAGAHLNLGLALTQLGRTAEAEAALQRAIELDPELGVPQQSDEPTPAP